MKTALLVAVVTSSLSAAANAEPDTLQPSSAWQVDYGASSCTAARTYGPGPNPLVIALVPAPTFASTQITMIRKGTSDPIQNDVVIDGPKGSVSATVIDYSAGKARKIVSRIALTPEQYRQLAVDGPMRIRFRGFDRKVQLLNVAGVQRELDKCVADLNEVWQSPTQQARIKTEAESLMPLGHYFSDTDYPAQALRDHNSGSVGVRMMIDEDGKMQNCMTLTTSGSAILDAMTCFVLHDRAKFHPAVDVAGKPVKSVLDQRVVWRLAT